MHETPSVKPAFMQKWRRHIRVAVVLTALKFAVTVAISAYLLTRHHAAPAAIPAATEVVPQASSGSE